MFFAKYFTQTCGGSNDSGFILFKKKKCVTLLGSERKRQ